MSTLSKITVSLFVVAISAIVSSAYFTTAHANNGGAPAGSAGDPSASGNTCATSGCHSDQGAATPITNIITSTIPSAGYTPGATYDMFVILNKSAINKFGFEVSAQDLSGNAVGTLATADTKTKLVGAGKYITHTSTGTAATANSITWQFKWTAPSSTTIPDSVTFYGAFNAANSNGGTTGDQIFTSTSTFKRDTTASAVPTTPTGVSEYNNNATITIYPNPTSDVINISTGDAEIINVSVADANGKTLINSTASERIDISSLTNGKYFVSVTTNRGTATKQIIKQ